APGPGARALRRARQSAAAGLTRSGANARRTLLQGQKRAGGRLEEATARARIDPAATGRYWAPLGGGSSPSGLAAPSCGDPPSTAGPPSAGSRFTGGRRLARGSGPRAASILLSILYLARSAS